MTVAWGTPANENGIITKYALVFNYTFDGKDQSFSLNTSNKTFSHQFDVLGGIPYTVELWAETIKPGPKTTNFKQVPVYSKYGFHVSRCSRSNYASGCGTSNYIFFVAIQSMLF